MKVNCSGKQMCGSWKTENLPQNLFFFFLQSATLANKAVVDCQSDIWECFAEIKGVNI